MFNSFDFELAAVSGMAAFGTTMLKRVLNKYSVRQNVLITDDESKTRAFYEKAGFKPVTELGMIAFFYH